MNEQNERIRMENDEHDRQVDIGISLFEMFNLSENDFTNRINNERDQLLNRSSGRSVRRFNPSLFFYFLNRNNDIPSMIDFLRIERRDSDGYSNCIETIETEKNTEQNN